MNEQLLCYLPGPLGWSGTLERICREEDVRIIRVSPARCGQTLAALLGLLPAAAPSSAAAPREPVLVLCAFTRERMESFLDRLAREGVPPVLKAMVTPTNLGWSFSALAAELAKERRQLEG